MPDKQQTALFLALKDGGEVILSVYRQADGPYCSISGLGVRSGGYRTLDLALEAWQAARASVAADTPAGEPT